MNRSRRRGVEISPLPLLRHFPGETQEYLSDIIKKLDARVSSRRCIDVYLQRCFFPLWRDGGNLVVATSHPTADDRLWLKKRYGAFRPMKVERRVLQTLVAHRFRRDMIHEAVLALAEKNPKFSARVVVTRGQKCVLGFAAAIAVVALGCFPLAMLHFFVVAASVGFTIGACTRFVLATFGARPGEPSRHGRSTERMPDDALPVYTVLVPLYREAAVLPQLAGALQALDYPAEKLDIKFVVEEDDEETRATAERLSQHGPFETVAVPACLPRTKPKACNYAIRFARGEFLVIFDAEDRPAPDQLRKAVQAFRAAPDSVACLQARLAIDNAEASFLSALFALDYDLWFTALLPGLGRKGVPMPLGGTSNHFRTQALIRTGAWDPFNVTEDADLGIRLAQFGYGVAMLDSDTNEEAPIHYRQWLKQRTRWLKGYMQTLLVHLRDPAGACGRIGVGGVAALLLFIGGAVWSALVNPLLWFCFLISTVLLPMQTGADPVRIFAVVSGSGLFAANALLAGQVLSSQRWRRRPRSILYGFGLVFYWMLVSVAAWRALWQLIVKPHLWEKTPHGLSSRRPVAS